MFLRRTVMGAKRYKPILTMAAAVFIFVVVLQIFQGNGEVLVSKDVKLSNNQLSISGSLNSASEPNLDLDSDVSLSAKDAVQFGPRPSSKLQASSGQGETHDQWIVVTSIQGPTPQVKKLASLPGWKLVMVGDKKTPKSWSHPNVVYLSPEDQEALGYSVLKYVPYYSYVRKIVGYLYAIQHGAKVIYDTDDDNAPYTDLSGFDEPALFTVATEDRAYNPLKHFGQASMWPRGYPLDKIGMEEPHLYDVCSASSLASKNSTRYSRVLVKQGLVNGDPDLDALFRLTRKHEDTKNINITFDASAPVVTLPRGTFTPYNSQNTVFAYEALWALVLPRSVTMRVCDIWRAYWSQALLWLVGGRLAYYPPRTAQVRNAHSYILDAIDEYDLYGKTPALIDFLATWKCRSELTTLQQCAMQLTYDMAEKEFWKHSDVPFFHAWFQDLIDVGYTFPQMIPPSAQHPGACESPNRVTCYPTEQPTIRNHIPRLVPLDTTGTAKQRLPLCSTVKKQVF